MSDQVFEKRKEELRTKINRNRSIVIGLESSQSFKMAVEDFEENIKRANDNWHLINLDTPELFYQLKYNKLACLAVVQLIDNYKNDIERMELEIKKIDGEVDTSYWQD